MEFSAGLLVRLFVYSSLLWYANGILNSKPPVYRKAIIDNWEAHYHLGYVYGDMGQYEEAIMYFEESLKRRPGSLEINMMIAKHRQDIVQRDTRNREKAKKVATNPN